jgi:hypothetical protein
MRAKARDSCREMFSKLGILTQYSQYILSTLMFLVKHKDLFMANTKIHEINTRQKSDFHVPLLSLTKVQKGEYYSGITLFNSLPFNIKQVAHDINRFKYKLREFLVEKLVMSKC